MTQNYYFAMTAPPSTDENIRLNRSVRDDEELVPTHESSCSRAVPGYDIDAHAVTLQYAMTAGHLARR